MRQLIAHTLLAGSWVVISGVISRVTILRTHLRGLITLLITTVTIVTPFITTHEPPSIPYLIVTLIVAL